MVDAHFQLAVQRDEGVAVGGDDAVLFLFADTRILFSAGEAQFQGVSIRQIIGADEFLEILAHHVARVFGHIDAQLVARHGDSVFGRQGLRGGCRAGGGEAQQCAQDDGFHVVVLVG
ncbi:hypothetical protein D3C86_495910 [compost metagenome]